MSQGESQAPTAAGPPPSSQHFPAAPAARDALVTTPREDHLPCWGSVLQKRGAVLPFASAWLLSHVLSRLGFASNMLFPAALFFSMFSFLLVAAVSCPTQSPLDVTCFWGSSDSQPHTIPTLVALGEPHHHGAGQTTPAFQKS